MGPCNFEWVVSASPRRRTAAVVVVAAAVVAVGASASRGDLAGRYAEHQRQADQLQSTIRSETTEIQRYLGSISAIQARLTRVQRRLNVQERLLAQVRTELTDARH